MIRKVKGGYVVVSHKTGRRLSKPSTRGAAVRRLRQIQYFKRRGR